jgi:hypothetical protein
MMRGIVKGGLNDIHIDALINEYVIAAGENISAGDLIEFINGEAKKAQKSMIQPASTTFSSQSTSYISASAIDSSRVLVAYSNSGSSGYGTAIVLKVSGTTITSGSPIVFNSGNVSNISTTKLDSSRVLVAWYNPAPNLYVSVLSISGTTITGNAAAIIESTESTYTSVTTLDSGRVLLAYQNNSIGKAVVLSIAGSVITKGTPITFHNAYVYYVSAATLDSNRVVVSYRAAPNNNGMAIVLSVNGTTLTNGSPFVFSANIGVLATVPVNSIRVFLAYTNTENGGRGEALVLSVNGTTLSTGAPFVFEPVVGSYISTALLSSKRVVITYRGSNAYGRAVVLFIPDDGTALSVEVTYTFKSANVLYLSATTLDSGRVLVAYQDSANAGYGAATVLERLFNVQGIAIEGGAAGQTRRFYDWSWRD